MMKQANDKSTQADVLDLEERNWLPDYCQGDTAAFEKLMHRYQHMVYTFLNRYGIEKHTQDDVFQEVFLKIHQAAHRYKPSQALSPWIVSIILNTVRNKRRDEKRKVTFLHTLFHTPQNQQPSTDEITDQRDTMNWLESRISTLPQVQREVLTLTTLKGLRMQDIAKVMDVPESTVKTHLRRARMTLAIALSKREIAEQSV